MTKSYDIDTVVIKLIYYCNHFKEIYFKRKDVTDYIIESSPFDIPNKQGFDGNLSYFGYDVSIDTDGYRILVLRASEINKACLKGEIDFQVNATLVTLTVSNDYPNFFEELDSLISNKTNEAKAFNAKKRVSERMNLNECDFRVFGNQKIYQLRNEYYVFPKLIINPINNTFAYEIVNHSRYIEYNPYFIFPMYDNNFIETGVKLHRCEDFFYDGTIGSGNDDFYYFSFDGENPFVIDVGEFSLECVIHELSNSEYSLEDKETSRKVLSNVRLNTGALRKVALARDRNKCRVCSINVPELLICSHIKPWRDGEGRLDLDNVLSLCVFHDKLFDLGFISFSDEGVLAISDDLSLDSEMMNVIIEKTTDLKIEEHVDEVQQYLEYHRDNILR